MTKVTDEMIKQLKAIDIDEINTSSEEPYVKEFLKSLVNVAKSLLMEKQLAEAELQKTKAEIAKLQARKK